MKKITKKDKLNLLRWFRVLVQILFFIFLPAVFSQSFAAVKSVAETVGKGEVIKNNSFITSFIIVSIITILCGRIFCGWACSFGAFGDWIFQVSQFIQKKLKIKFPKISDRAIAYLKLLKYVVLMTMIVFCFCGRASFVANNSPWTIFSLVRVGQFKFAVYLTSTILMCIVIIGMAIKERFFCQFLCPLGAIFAMLPVLPFISPKRNEDNCIPKCNACKNNCPVKIKLQDNSLTDGECISCMRCRVICPKGNIKN